MGYFHAVNSVHSSLVAQRPVLQRVSFPWPLLPCSVYFLANILQETNVKVSTIHVHNCNVSEHFAPNNVLHSLPTELE